VIRWLKKRCLALSKADRAADLACAFQRARFAGDVGRLQRGVEIVVDDAERARIGVVDADLLVGEPVLDSSYSTPS